MSHEALSDEERAQLLAVMPADLVEKIEASTPDVETVTTTSTTTDADTLARQFLDKAKGNLDTAKQLAVKWADAEFDKVKLSKIQAAALGVDKSAHNKAEYARVQRERVAIDNAMRKNARGHVKQKIAANKAAKVSPDLDAFMLANQDNDILRQFLALQGAE